MNAAATAATLPQHMQALAHANRVRLARAALKREIGTGKRDAPAVILDCPWEVDSMTRAEREQTRGDIDSAPAAAARRRARGEGPIPVGPARPGPPGGRPKVAGLS